MYPATRNIFQIGGITLLCAVSNTNNLIALRRWLSASMAEQTGVDKPTDLSLLALFMLLSFLY